jgi:hypothetical protein
VSDIYVARASRLAARRLATETIILCPDDSGLYVLNAVGTAVWEAADGTTPLSAIIERVICQEFDVDPDTAAKDASLFIDGLREHGILTVSDHPIEGGEQPADAAPREVTS